MDPFEFESLQQQLHEASTRVLEAQSDDVDAEDVGNWQLLGAIEAWVGDDKVDAN